MGKVLGEVTADERGFYRMAGLVPGEIRVWARINDADDRVAHSDQHIRRGVELTWDPVLSPVDGIRVRLIDDDGKPLAGWILSFAPEGRKLSDWRRELVTDAEGRATLYECPDEPVRIHVFTPERDNFPLASVASATPDPTERVITVAVRSRFPGTVTGHVFDSDGNRFAAADLVLVDLETKAIAVLEVDPATGGFRVDVPAGRYQIDVRCAGVGCLPLGVHGIEPGGTLDLGIVRAPALGTLRVHGHWPDASSNETYEFLLAGGQLLDGEWLYVHIDQGSKRPRESYRVLPGNLSLAVARDGVLLHKRHVHVDPGEEAAFETGPQARAQLRVVVVVPPRLRLASQVTLRVTRLEHDRDDEFVKAEVVSESRLGRAPSGAFERFVALLDGMYLVEAETDTGLRGSERLAIDRAAVLGALTIRLD